MKKCWIVGFLVLLLCGCGGQQTFEPVLDDYELPVAAPLHEISVSLPEDAAQPVLQSTDAGRLYFCNGYTLSLQTLSGGDLDRTLRSITGYGKDSLALIATAYQGADRYECAWTAAGEGAQQVGRAVVLDDGSSHYVVTVMADADAAGQLRSAWDSLLASVRLTDTD
ncbi:MAG: hypothetical protein J6A74_02610 [Oscillospiraceae bacterium]|nr:hypothetical protein [Oscillospiraceae bacterium]